MLFKKPAEVKETKDVNPAEDTYKDTIPSAKHWKNMQTRLNQFNALEIKASTSEDELLYQKLNIKYGQKIKDGLASEGYNFLCKPFLTGVALSAHSLEECPDENEYFRTYSHPHGIKSLAFLELVLLPYLMDSQHVRYTSQYPVAQKMIDFFSSPGSYIYTGTLLYNHRADELRKAINYFKANNPTLVESLSEIARHILPVIDVNAANPSSAITDKVEKSPAP